ncbi:MAG: ABC transporter ATP-binding protein [Acidimicrobiia bacterium]
MAVIEAQGLRKVYGRRVAVGGLDLEVPDGGGVFGFLGPNGSGKTTTIRMLLGLISISSGQATVLGERPGPGLHRVMPRIGAIVESPALFPAFSGRRNLELLGRIQGVGPRAVDAALTRVGLAERADDRVAKYSLGMKQRAALAAALLTDPELLILDEPANGLDPQGMKELRDLVKSLGAEGRTVLVSSHLLAEIQLMCDRVAIIQGGVRVTQGTVEDLLAMGRPTGLLLRVTDALRAAEVLESAGIACTATGESDQLRVDLPHDAGARVTETLAIHGIYLRELLADEVDLETVFLELTRRGPQIP